MSGEDRLIAWLRRRAAGQGGELLGDDAAVLPESERWAVTVDTQIEGVHFLSGLDPATLAARLVAVNLSDLAAMGARPAYAFLALAATEGFDHRRFFKALLRSARKHDFKLAGGDLSTSTRVTGVMTLLGRSVSGGQWLERGGARAGENLWLGGVVGEAAAGAFLIQEGATLEGRKVILPESFTPAATIGVRAAARRAVKRHLLPRPQLELGEWLARAGAGGVIDVSDGLARDLHRLCRASGVGAVIDLAAVPTPRDFRALAAALDLSWRRTALAGGEDYVLLFTLPPALEPPPGCHLIGRVVAGRGVDLIDGDRRRPLAALGWDHLEKK